MLENEKTIECEEMGIEFSKKTGKVKSFNPNKFATFTAKKLQIIYNKDSFYVYNDGIWNKISDMYLFQKLRGKLQTYSDNIWSLKNEKEYIGALKRIVFFEEELNSNKRYINLRNGMFDLNTYSLMEHRPEFYSSIRIPVDYNEEDECPNFIRFLNQCFNGDEEAINLAQEWVGYILTAETRAQKALILYGLGKNGKGIFIDIISELIGQENISSIPMNELSRPFSRVCIYGKLANISNENEFNGASLNTQYFKAIVGEDIITAEQKNQPVIQFKPTARMVFSTNNLPHTNDGGYAFMRRLCMLHFKNVVKEEDRDFYLREKLKEELNGIFNWALVGLRRLKENNFRFSECNSSNKLLKQYEMELNPMILFFEQCVEKEHSDHREDNRIIYNTYKSWARANGMEGQAKISVQKFWRKFDAYAKSLGYECESKKSNSFRYHTGVKIVGCFRISLDDSRIFGQLGG